MALMLSKKKGSKLKITSLSYLQNCSINSTVSLTDLPVGSYLLLVNNVSQQISDLASNATGITKIDDAVSPIFGSSYYNTCVYEITNSSVTFTSVSNSGAILVS